jgi:hypothetical protein
VRVKGQGDCGKGFDGVCPEWCSTSSPTSPWLGPRQPRDHGILGRPLVERRVRNMNVLVLVQHLLPGVEGLRGSGNEWRTKVMDQTRQHINT